MSTENLRSSNPYTEGQHREDWFNGYDAGFDGKSKGSHLNEAFSKGYTAGKNRKEYGEDQYRRSTAKEERRGGKTRFI